MIIGFFVGFAIGFILSVPPLGPTYFAIIERAMKKEFNNAVAIGVGAGFMDMIYILIAYGGVSAIASLLPDSFNQYFLANEETFKMILAVLGCIVVILYGIKIMRTKTKLLTDKAEKFDEEKFKKKIVRVETVFKKTELSIDKILHRKPIVKENSNLPGSFLLGIVMCLSSVTLPASWFATVGYLKSYGIIDSNFFTGLLLAIGVLIGTSIWFYIMTKLITKYKDKLSPNVLNKLNFSTGVFLVLLGVGFLIKLSTMYL
ncbi:MAG: LysE family transporter [Bacteroidota bacterium]|nr:LysE family transporter [Bacteroidota bacterium]